MTLFLKKPVVVEASRWYRNGDHPLDGSNRSLPGGADAEGWVVRRYRRPDVPGDRPCGYCLQPMDAHGWIDTAEGGHVVCPGDWIVTGVAGERYPCKPAIFERTYELAGAEGRDRRADLFDRVVMALWRHEPQLADAVQHRLAEAMGLDVPASSEYP